MKRRLITVPTSQHAEMLEITAEVNAALAANDNASGLLCLRSLHTTAGITVNENADPDVIADMLLWFDEVVPWTHARFRHAEGNSAAHIKTSLLGTSLCLPFYRGKLDLGRWQGIFLCEFDGPRQRQVEIITLAQEKQLSDI
jgi:secondary thiamine-phosphate synthase enzyme